MIKKLLGFLAASMIACAPLSTYGDNDDFDYDFSRINEIPAVKKIRPVVLFISTCRFNYCFFDWNFNKNNPLADLLEAKNRLYKEWKKGNISEETFYKRAFSAYYRSGKDFLITSIVGHWVVDVLGDQQRIPYGATIDNAVKDTEIEMLVCRTTKDWCERIWTDKWLNRFKKNDVDEKNEGDWFLVANKDDGVAYEGVSDGVAYDFYKGATTIKCRLKPQFNVDFRKEDVKKFHLESDWGLNEYTKI
ncbi:hypothetical protein E5K94_06595 [Helicobacter pylori]|nr:hypothetical protein E5K94_06595 [Helicobacter pylori]